MPLDRRVGWDVDVRQDIIANMDAAECEGCGQDATHAAGDPSWFVDSEVDASGTERAIIRCPLCW